MHIERYRILSVWQTTETLKYRNIIFIAFSNDRHTIVLFDIPVADLWKNLRAVFSSSILVHNKHVVDPASNTSTTDE